MTDTDQIQPLSHSFLKSLVSRAINAPSGDNSQPWQFSVEENSVTILNLPDADETLYNFNQRGSFFAHGAVIENISIIAETCGYNIDVSLFPSIPDAVATITFIPTVVKNNLLEGFIEERSTNRRPYKKISLREEDRRAILQAIKDRPRIQLRLVEERSVINLLARTVSVNERLLMENRALHDFLFSMIRWDKKDEARAPGLYLKTMELPPPVQVLFRFVFRHWKAVLALNHIGLSHFIPIQSAPVYAASSAFAALVINGDKDEDFVAAGRSFQRLWLTATAQGVYIQPVTAIPYLYQRIEEETVATFTPKHQELVREAYSIIAKEFQIQPTERIAMLFRLGYGDKPSAPSLKGRQIFKKF